MSKEEFIIRIFCFVNDYLEKFPHTLRHRGPKPRLGDDEVLAMEIAGEFFGMDKDKDIHCYFKDHWFHFFPDIGDRSAFVRQCANLWSVKILLQRHLARLLGAFDDGVHVVDGFPIPVCGFGRAHFSRLFKGEARYGYCASKSQTYYGFKGHLLIAMDGTVTGIALTAANADEREAAMDFCGDIGGTLLGDKGYIGAKERFAQYGIALETPVKSNMRETRHTHVLAAMKRVRRKVETVIGQLAERFSIEKVRARDMWHLTSRIYRKVLSHTMGVFLARRAGLAPLNLAGLVRHT